ncbi:MAG TPA: S9 family peptidase [Urbifossiella sp.]|nr:S9 family peptidase [Urbifossiella sp.]
MRRTLPVLIMLAVCQPAGAQPRPVTPADYASVNTITEVALSPDGSTVAYCLATWDEKADNRRTDLWVVPADGKGTPRRLTTDRANDRHPKWSADGKTVYVLRNARKANAAKAPLDGSAQVWRVAADGTTPPGAVTRVKGGVEAFDYAPKADTVFYAIESTVTDTDDFLQLRERFPKIEFGHGKRKVSELYQLTPNGGEGIKVVEEQRYVREFAVSADGKRLAMITAPDDTVVRSEGDSLVDVWDAASKTVTATDQSWKKTAASPWPWLESLAWNEDGTRLAYCTIFDGYPAEVIVCQRREEGWPAVRVPRADGHHVHGYGSPLRWADGSVRYLSDKSGTHDLRGWNPDYPDASALKAVVVGPGATVFAFDARSASKDQYKAVVVRGNGSGLPVLGSYGPTGRTTIVDPNPQAKDWLLPTVEHITWKAPDGSAVGGALELPPGYQKGAKKLPLVVAIHGGPTTSSTAALQFDPHNGRLYFASAGYAVLAPNYRGSTGYGDKFTKDLIGRENDLEVKDILAGIRHLIDAGIADPDRIAVMGWSNGGYLTNCLIALPDPPVRIRAASSGAGILDTVAEWGFNDEPAYPRVFKLGLPWERPEVYHRTSPTYQLGNIKTPTLIHVGANDVRCPPGHSRMLYRALRENLGVPTQLCVYPGEPHGLTKLSYRRAKMEWDLAWFDRYLRPTSP